MPGLVPGIYVLPTSPKTWMAGTSPAMTIEVDLFVRLQIVRYQLNA
jgi:hypothetical protein